MSTAKKKTPVVNVLQRNYSIPSTQVPMWNGGPSQDGDQHMGLTDATKSNIDPDKMVLWLIAWVQA